MHFRIGNVTEMFTTTLLLRLVDQHVVKLSDRVSRWFPQLQRSRQVTLKMLATSTSGYADYVTSNQFSNAFEQNPFARFSPIKLITLGTSVLPPVFAPGKSWAFSDTNFLLLGAILQKITHRPLARALRQQILNPLGLHQTLMPFTAAIPSPVMHAYTNERGNYEDSTFWDINWVALEGSMISSLSDLGKWAQAFGSGALVSRASHRLAFGRGNVGLGPLTPSRYYGIGALVAKHWILANPTVDGYSGLVAYYPPKKLAVVVFSTIGPRGNITVSYSTAAMIKLARILTPGSVPALATQPRGTSTR
jgi:CubicO group peptidase (beta-lactamase class C family)